MTLWLVRAGKNGEQEESALTNNVAVIGWEELPDLSSITTRENLRELFEQTYPESKKNTTSNKVGQIWTFTNRIKKGDLVVLPLKHSSAVAVGVVKGPYSYRIDIAPNIRHTLPVDWLNTEIPRTAFDQDILYSLGAFMTVCQIQRNNAEERIRRVAFGKGTSSTTDTTPMGTDEEQIDIEQAARDQILDYINRKFKGHNLTRLIEAILEAEGYITMQSDPGPDGGVDILAGSGPMGFDSPRICVQVKSSQSPVDVTVFRALQGSLNSFNADRGLLVSWGGFTRSVLSEARRHYFSIRLWDSGEVIEALLKNYSVLPDTLQAELPLKRVWSLVQEEDAD
ncbi:restriction endonuclease [Bhargavaea ullalensis]|uniref:Restriction system protein n=1 Tax=Bhargavaea ullalensis TaxID=1265685 RepID=A0ABV2GB52_9BACL